MNTSKNLSMLAFILASLITGCGGSSSDEASSTTDIVTTPPVSSDNTNNQTDNGQASNSDNSNSDNSSTNTDSNDSSSGDPSSDDKGDDTSVTSLADIVIDKEFDLSTRFDLNIDLALNSTQRAFLNVCQKKQESDRADYTKCLLRKPVVDGKVIDEISVSRSDILLVGEVWFYNENPVPVSFIWQYDQTKEQQTFVMRY